MLEDDISFDIELKHTKTLNKISNAIHGDDWDICYIGHDFLAKQSVNHVTVEENSGRINLTHCLAFNKNETFSPSQIIFSKHVRGSVKCHMAS